MMRLNPCIKNKRAITTPMLITVKIIYAIYIVSWIATCKSDPQKIAEIREKKKIVIDEHSGRILADVDMESMEEEAKPKKAAPAKRKKVG